LDRGGKIEFAKIGNAKQRSTLELESHWFSKKKVFAGFGAFFDSKTSILKKKIFAGFRAFFGPKTLDSQKKKRGLRRILERFLVPNMAHDTGLRVAKVAQGGQLPPYFPRLCLYV